MRRDVPSSYESPHRAVGGMFRALRNRNYRLYFTGQTISLSGTWMQTIAQALLVLKITDSKVALGTVTLLQFLPITLFVLFAGVIADRVPKRNFILATQLLAMSQALMLAALVWSGRVELWHVYVLALVLGLANALRAADAAGVRRRDGREGRPDERGGAELRHVQRRAADRAGHRRADHRGVRAEVGVPAERPELRAGDHEPADDGHEAALQRRARGRRANPLTELREGLSYAFRTPAVLMIIILVAIVGTFGYNFTVMLPLLARYVLHEGSAGLGFMTAAVGLGALISALALAGRKAATKEMLFGGGAGFALMLGAVAVSQWFAATLLFLLLLGIANTAFAATANTSLQLATPDHLRGRVMSLYMLLFAGSTPIGGFLTGFMAEHLGVATAIGINAGACALGVAAGLLYYVSHRSKIAATAVSGAPA